MKGNFLDSVSLPVSKGKSADVEVKSYSGDEGTTTVDDGTESSVEVFPPNDALLLPAESKVQSESTLPTQFDLELEKAQTLDFVSSLFGGSENEDNWIGPESLGSDVEMEELAKESLSLTGDEPTVPIFEEVPMAPEELNTRTMVYQMDSDKRPSKAQPVAVDLPTTKVTLAEENTITNLKDLFAPREEGD